MCRKCFQSQEKCIQPKRILPYIVVMNDSIHTEGNILSERLNAVFVQRILTGHGWRTPNCVLQHDTRAGGSLELWPIWGVNGILHQRYRERRQQSPLRLLFWVTQGFSTHRHADHLAGDSCAAGDQLINCKLTMIVIYDLFYLCVLCYRLPYICV